jgi:hypothetical protein
LGHGTARGHALERGGARGRGGQKQKLWPRSEAKPKATAPRKRVGLSQNGYGFADLSLANGLTMHAASFYGEPRDKSHAMAPLRELIEPHTTRLGPVATGGDFNIPAHETHATLAAQHAGWRVLSGGPTCFTATGSSSCVDYFVVSTDAFGLVRTLDTRLTLLATRGELDLCLHPPALPRAQRWRRPPKPAHCERSGPKEQADWAELRRALADWRHAAPPVARMLRAGMGQARDAPRLAQLWRRWGLLAAKELAAGQGPVPSTLESNSGTAQTTPKRPKWAAAQRCTRRTQEVKDAT